MSDSRLRDLERRWAETGADDDGLAYFVECRRAGVSFEHVLEETAGSALAIVQKFAGRGHLPRWEELVARVRSTRLDNYGGADIVARLIGRAPDMMNGRVSDYAHAGRSETLIDEVNQVVGAAGFFGNFPYQFEGGGGPHLRNMFDSQLRGEDDLGEGDDYLDYETALLGQHTRLDRALEKAGCLALVGNHIEVAKRFAEYRPDESRLSSSQEEPSSAVVYSALAAESLFLGKDVALVEDFGRLAFDACGDNDMRRIVATRITIAAMKCKRLVDIESLVGKESEASESRLRKDYVRFADEVVPQVVEKTPPNWTLDGLLREQATPINYVQLALTLAGKRKYAQAVLSD